MVLIMKHLSELHCSETWKNPNTKANAQWHLLEKSSHDPCWTVPFPPRSPQQFWLPQNSPGPEEKKTYQQDKQPRLEIYSSKNDYEGVPGEMKINRTVWKFYH